MKPHYFTLVLWVTVVLASPNIAWGCRIVFTLKVDIPAVLFPNVL
jgi:hypothetical protein